VNSLTASSFNVLSNGAVRKGSKDYAVAARFAVKTAEKKKHTQGPRNLPSEFSSAKWLSPPQEG